jgi:YihY family inner membrane protein
MTGAAQPESEGHAAPARGPGRSRAAARVLRHPVAFGLRVLRSFRANQGFLLASAVAFNTLLSTLPLLILLLIGLTHVVEAPLLLSTLERYLELLVPGQASAVVEELSLFLAHREVVSWVLVVTLVFFSSLAFTVLENAMSVIFLHRVKVRRRRLAVSLLIPFCYIAVLAVGLLLVSLVAGALEAMSHRSVEVLGRTESLGGVSAVLLYLIGIAGEILVLTSIYLVMPVGRLRLSHALIGGVTAGLLWELTRHGLVWYFSTLSQVKLVYGSLTTSIVVLLSLEIASLVLLLGAQVIAEYERLLREGRLAPPQGLRTD